MTNARQIADERLASGEIATAQHAAIVAALATSAEPAGKVEQELTALGWVIAILSGLNFSFFLISLLFLNTGPGKVAAVFFGLIAVLGMFGTASASRPKKARHT